MIAGALINFLNEADRLFDPPHSFLGAHFKMAPFTSDEEIYELVRSFEAGEINPEHFKHYQHLAVALCYVVSLPFIEATDKVRTGIQRLAAAHGKSGYHETITRFWLAVVQEFAAQAEVTSLHILANRLATEYVDKHAINNYYSERLLASREAKNGYVEPDLQPFHKRDRK